ncbi:MAG TPA: hypothetical protein VFX70_11925 [Mycobacteriales bacterium]|nr:hypothetical protein [Mycobacteriales bacterium]
MSAPRHGVRPGPAAAVVAVLAAALTPLLPAAPAAASPAPAGVSWRVDLTRPATRVNVDTGPSGLRLVDSGWHPGAMVGGYGQVLFPPRSLPTPVAAVTAYTTARVPAGASAAVEVRGGLPDGRWTEWRQAGANAPAVLPVPSRTVQVRVVLTAGTGRTGPTLTRLVLHAGAGAAVGGAVSPAAEVAFTVFATREGLVGGTTANGHTITSHDHFVALPSGRALSPAGAGDFSVRVCAASTGRCEYAPVWDIGPWNTRDDYWNPSSVRQNWQSLPQGTPEAQAAFFDGFNGGRDQFGRTVLNPAGIDLADGVFFDGLELADNGFVTVDYLWTGNPPLTGSIVTASGGPLTVRSGPHTSDAAVGLAAAHARVNISCQVSGDTETGPRGTSTHWDLIGPGNFVSDAFVNTNGVLAQPC